jgi:mono/diheme cytochrome c family protein
MAQRIRLAALVLLATATAWPAFSQARGAEVYKAKCASCHGADGQAATSIGKAMKVLPFKDPTMMKASDAQFVTSSKNGKGKMPPYAGKLTDAQIGEVTAYIRTLQK